jgi:MFS family permease
MRRLLTLACTIVLVDTIFYAALSPLVPFFDEEFGLSKSVLGVLAGAYGAGVLVGSAPGSYLCSRAGVKVTAVVGLVLVSLMSLGFALAGSAWLLVLVRFTGGFGSALSWVAAFTWLTRRAPEERRGEVIGIMISAAVFGALLGPVLGSVAATVGLVPAFAALAVIGMGIALWAVVESAPGPPDPVPLAPTLTLVLRPRLATGLWLIALSPLLFSSLVVLVPLELSRLGWGAAAVGAVFLASAAFEAAVHPLLGRWSDRTGYRRPALTGLLASIALLLALPYASSPWTLALLVVLAAGAFNATLVPGTALFSRGTEKAGMEGAVAFGVINFVWASGYAVGAPVGGALADFRSDALAYLFLTVVCLLTLLMVRRV